MNIRSKKNLKRQVISEINVTPFVDVMLVLLIIFMVTAPLLTSGIKVNLPESSANALSEKTEPVTITVNKDGKIFLQKKQLSKNQLITKLTEIKKNNQDLKIFIKGDSELNYGKIISIMGDINKAGFKKVALITKLK